MGKQAHTRATRLLFAGGVFLALAAVVLTWSHAGTRVAAQVSPGLDFSMSIANHPSCDTRQGNVSCELNPGERFAVNMSLNSLPADVPEYSGFDIELNYTGVTSEDNGNTQTWPDCAFPAGYFQPGLVGIGCATGLPPAGPSTYTGMIGSNDFTCTQSGEIRLAHGVGHTDLIDTGSNPLVEAADGAETLTISCGVPPATPGAGTPTPGGPGGLPGGGTGGGSGQSVPWAAISAMLALGAAALVASGWKLARGN